MRCEAGSGVVSSGLPSCIALAAPQRPLEYKVGLRLRHVVKRLKCVDTSQFASGFFPCLSLLSSVSQNADPSGRQEDLLLGLLGPGPAGCIP